MLNSSTIGLALLLASVASCSSPLTTGAALATGAGGNTAGGSGGGSGVAGGSTGGTGGAATATDFCTSTMVSPMPPPGTTVTCPLDGRCPPSLAAAIAGLTDHTGYFVYAVSVVSSGSGYTWLADNGPSSFHACSYACDGTLVRSDFCEEGNCSYGGVVTFGVAAPDGGTCSSSLSLPAFGGGSAAGGSEGGSGLGGASGSGDVGRPDAGESGDDGGLGSAGGSGGTGAACDHPGTGGAFGTDSLAGFTRDCPVSSDCPPDYATAQASLADGSRCDPDVELVAVETCGSYRAWGQIGPVRTRQCVYAGDGKPVGSTSCMGGACRFGGLALEDRTCTSVSWALCSASGGQDGGSGASAASDR